MSHPMTAVAARFTGERRFYVSAAIGVAIIVLAGFSIDVDLLRDMSGLSALVRLHGAVMLGWIALFVTQTALVARRRIEWHRRLGIVGTVLAVLIVTMDTMTVIVAARLGGNHLPPGMPPRLFLARGLFDLVTFAVLVSGAIVLRRHSAWHKRLMLLAALLLLDAAVSRFIGAYTPWDLDAAWVRDALILTCAGIDTLRYRRLHPAFVVGGLLVFVTDPLANWAAAGPAWARFCAWLA